MTFKNYVFKNLWLQVVLSLILGLAVGLILGDDAGAGLDDDTLDTLISYLKIPANLFLSIIQMIIVPLIFASIVVAITNLGAKDKLKTLGLGVGVYFVITTTMAILVAVFLASVISPGSILDLSALQESHDLSDDELQIKDGFSLDDIPSVIPNIIPSNPIFSYLEGQMFSILVMALIVGLSMACSSKRISQSITGYAGINSKNNIIRSIVFYEDCTICSFWINCWNGCHSWYRNRGGIGSIHGNCCSGSWNYVIDIHIILKVCSKKTDIINVFKIP